MSGPHDKDQEADMKISLKVHVSNQEATPVLPHCRLFAEDDKFFVLYALDIHHLIQ